MTNVIKITY